MPATEPSDLVLTRSFDAPAAAIYAAWTEPALVRRWWGPSGFTCPTAEMDARVGGVSFVSMRAPAEWGGMELFNTWTYSAVEPGRRLEFVLRFCDERRTAISPQSIGVPPGVPHEVAHILTFVDREDGRSDFTIVERGYSSAEAIEASRTGLVQTLEKLAGAVRS